LTNLPTASGASSFRRGSTRPLAAAAYAQPLAAPGAPDAPRREIVVVIDGMNVGRNLNCYDPEYHQPGPKRRDFEEMRRQNKATEPPLLAFGVLAAIDCFLQANDSTEARAAHVEYKPMAFLVQWVRDGGRTGHLMAFNAEKLEPYADYISFTPPRRDDDEAQIRYAKSELASGREVYVVTNDNWDDHKRNGKITQRWFAEHVIPFSWIGRTNKLLLTPPDGIDLPGL